MAHVSGARYIVADVFAGLASLEPNSVDCIVSSPPFLNLRSYLPDDDPMKAFEMGSEPTPAAFLDSLLDVVEACDRVLAPHGSLVFELGDTRSGSGGHGGDYNEGGLRAGQPKFEGSAAAARVGSGRPDGAGWPMDKSLSGIPTLFAWSLAYGYNILTGPERVVGVDDYGNELTVGRSTPRWRIRSLMPWIRANPPVGALGDKVRDATSYVIVACKARDRYFDLDAVRSRLSDPDHVQAIVKGTSRSDGWGRPTEGVVQNPAGAPPLDWWHHTDAVLDAELARWAGKSPTHARAKKGVGTQARAGKSAAIERGGNFATLDEQEVGDGDATTIRGRHLRKALERAGILEPAADVLEINSKGYPGAHYAVYPPELVEPLIKMMVPHRVCIICGQPSRRVTEVEYEAHGDAAVQNAEDRASQGDHRTVNGSAGMMANGRATRVVTGSTWTECDCTCGCCDSATCDSGCQLKWRRGMVLDPFAGSGTTLAVSQGHGHDAIGFDLDKRNAELALERVGPLFLTIETLDPKDAEWPE